MVRRTDMRAIGADLSLAAARRAALEARHGRLPVFRGSADNVVGYVDWVDLFGSDDPSWTDRLHELPILPESLSASLALARLRDSDGLIAATFSPEQVGQVVREDQLVACVRSTGP